MKLHCGLIASCLLFFSALADDGVLKLTSGAVSNPGRYINPELVGFNLLYWIDDDNQFASGKLVKQIDGIHPALLRYPAGTASQNYDWRSNSTINEKLFPFHPDNTLLSTDDYIQTVKQSGAKGIVVVDITSVHLKDRKKAVNKGQQGYQVAQPASEEDEQAMVDKAVAWAKYFKEKEFSPAFYELGNEHYLAFLDYMVFTPEMYAEKCKRFIKAIRAVDPDAQFAVGGPESFDGSHSYYENIKWWPVVLKALAPDVNRIVLHKYWKPKNISSASAIPDLCREFGDFRKDLVRWGKQSGVSTEHLKIGFTEWGGRGNMDKQTFGLFCFGVLTGFVENGVDYAVEWPFRWLENGEFGEVQLIEKSTETPRFAYYVLSAWSRFFSGKHVVDLEKHLPVGISGFAAVDDDGKPVLALSNQTDALQTVKLNVDWPGCCQTAALFAVTADGIRDIPAEQVNSIDQVEISPGTLLIVQAQ